MNIRNTFLLFLMSSLIIISGCSAKDETVKKEPGSTSTSQPVNNEQEASVKNNRSDEIKAPNFRLATLDGEEFYLSDFSGKVVLLNFWGTWCPPCRKEIPDLVSLQEKYNQDGLEIVGITLNSGSAADIQKFVDEKNINYTILTDFNNSETEQVTILIGQTIGQQITSIPTTLVIDREGYIVKGYLGPRTEDIFYNDLKEYL